jgi:carbon-monoxide dehydrogenase iron sulfur subunit
MVCPFGVLRYHEDTTAPPGKTVAVKCDNCIERQGQGVQPACVEICKSNALTFEALDDAMKRKTDAVSRSVSVGVETPELSPGFSLLNTYKKEIVQLRTE